MNENLITQCAENIVQKYPDIDLSKVTFRFILGVVNDETRIMVYKKHPTLNPYVVEVLIKMSDIFYESYLGVMEKSFDDLYCEITHTQEEKEFWEFVMGLLRTAMSQTLKEMTGQ
jgi:hypothetical protein